VILIWVLPQPIIANSVPPALIVHSVLAAFFVNSFAHSRASFLIDGCTELALMQVPRNPGFGFCEISRRICASALLLVGDINQTTSTKIITIKPQYGGV
jgi:hypothetical protein